MNLHKYQLYLNEQHRHSFKIWLAIIRINAEGNVFIMQLGPNRFFPQHQLDLAYIHRQIQPK